jgi:hypothetical protein
VGSREFVDEIARQTEDRAKLEFGETEEGAWTLKEPECPYGRELETLR